ncbi:hypothetical protein ZIOFF_076187 [Zingiber officinale]|uniref:ATP-dependent Clp protease proteolytic subunit n=1 Tax=Zingiber officinale TaxID=94328 RepID=A0A8J5CPF6_ZINOF|nr:hypothetical protein ZIOFF_076187 [Zingiber officinale]
MTPLLLSNFVRQSRCFYSVSRGATSNVAVESSDNVFSHIFLNRRILLLGEIAENTASKAVDSMIKMQIKNVERPISLLISFDGGELLKTFSILEIMKLCSYLIYIFSLGQAGSMASLVLAASTPCHWYSLPISRIMIHKPYFAEKTSKQALTEPESSKLESIKPALLESSDDVMILNEELKTIRKMPELEKPLRHLTSSPILSGDLDTSIPSVVVQHRMLQLSLLVSSDDGEVLKTFSILEIMKLYILIRFIPFVWNKPAPWLHWFWLLALLAIGTLSNFQNNDP